MHLVVYSQNAAYHLLLFEDCLGHFRIAQHVQFVVAVGVIFNFKPQVLISMLDGAAHFAVLQHLTNGKKRQLGIGIRGNLTDLLQIFGLAKVVHCDGNDLLIHFKLLINGKIAIHRIAPHGRRGNRRGLLGWSGGIRGHGRFGGGGRGLLAGDVGRAAAAGAAVRQEHDHHDDFNKQRQHHDGHDSIALPCAAAVSFIPVRHGKASFRRRAFGQHCTIRRRGG